MDDVDKLSLLFEKIIERVKRLKKEDPKFKQEKVWKKIEKILKPLDKHKASGWKNIKKDLKESILDLPEYYIDGRGNKKITHEHFLMEQLRIPERQDPTLKEILHIAYYAGLYKGSKNINKEKDKMDNITTYVKKDGVKKLADLVDDDVVNGIMEILT